jgi:glutamate synthase (NADPH/NADH) small chain
MSEANQRACEPQYQWRELPRERLPRRSAVERLSGFLEIYGPYDEKTAREQASRCIQCPEPSCVTGCPLSQRIPEWLGLTAEGHFLEAAAILHTTSSLPEVCARVCPSDRLCEGLCILNGKAEPVSIRAIEQFLNEYAFAHGEAERPGAPPNGWRVAVIGSGPGGLACADLLSTRGYAVTVFDWRPRPGGLLVSGTPAFRLERSIVNRRIELLQKRGVVFRLGVPLGEGLALRELQGGFDAIYLAFGARKARELEVPGRHLKGVAQALSFLVQNETGFAHDLPPIEVKGKRVAVLGGGDLAMDCLRTALRSGASEAVCVCRREADDLPCVRSEYENAVEEGGQFLFRAAPVAVLGNDRGEVTGLRLIRTELGAADGAGRRTLAILPGTEFDIPAARVFVALGFEPLPLPDQNPFGSLARNEQGGLRVDDNQMTSTPGIFAGGDLVRGPSTVLNTVRDARRATQGIQDYLFSRQKA